MDNYLYPNEWQRATSCEGTFECCGINELCNIEGTPPIQVMGEVFASGDNERPFIIFSTADTDGPRLRRFIQKHKLGSVWQSPAKNNPTGSRRLRIYVWCPVKRGPQIAKIKRMYREYIKKEIDQ